MIALVLFAGVTLGAILVSTIGWGAVFTAMGLLLAADALVDLRRYRKPSDG